MGFKDFYEAATAIFSKRELAMAWIVRRRWAPVGFFALICTLLAMLFASVLNYYEYKNSQSITIQLDEARWKDFEVRYTAIIDSINLCISEPQESENKDWYCEEAFNRYKAELPITPLNDRVKKNTRKKSLPTNVGRHENWVKSYWLGTDHVCKAGCECSGVQANPQVDLGIRGLHCGDRSGLADLREPLSSNTRTRGADTRLM